MSRRGETACAVWCVAIALAAAACHSPPCSGLVPLSAERTDILFVVDDAATMGPKQAALAAALPGFVGELENGSGVPLDVQLGLVTSSVYQFALFNNVAYYQAYFDKGGRLQPVPDLGADGGVQLGTGSERILVGSDANLVDKLARLVQVGTSGSAQRTPFEAIRLALTVLSSVSIDGGGNQGFLRDDAQLLVLTVSDKDDCSEVSDIFDAGWHPSVVVDLNGPVVPLPDECLISENILTPTQTYLGMINALVDASGHERSVLWSDLGPVSVGRGADGRFVAQSTLDVDAGTLRNVDCPVSFGPGFRHLGLSRLFDGTEDDMASVCLADYSVALHRVAQRLLAGQTMQLTGVRSPAASAEITRGDGTVQICGTTPDAGAGPNDRISFAVSSSGVEVIHFHGACERRLDDLKVELRCP
jgi:hypothetical protein